MNLAMINRLAGRRVRRALPLGPRGRGRHGALAGRRADPDLTASEFGGYNLVVTLHGEGSLGAQLVQAVRDYDVDRCVGYAGNIDGRAMPADAVAPRATFVIRSASSAQLPPVGDVARYFAQAEADRWYSNSGACHRELTDPARDLPRPGPALRAAGQRHACLRGRDPHPRAPHLPGDRGHPAVVHVRRHCRSRGAGWPQPRVRGRRPRHWHLTAETIRAGGSPRTALVLACSTFGAPPPQEVSDG